jgi:alpha-L-fucosidase
VVSTIQFIAQPRTLRGCSGSSALGNPRALSATVPTPGMCYLDVAPLPALLALLLMQQLAPAAAAATPTAAAAPPPANVLAYQGLRTSQFMHFSICTFHNCEQDERSVYPAASFAPTGTIDTDQWLRVARSWGAQQVCLTAHHSGGFALWQTNTTDYGVRQSPYMNGTADIVRDFMASCRKFDVSPCLYFIPAEDGAAEKHNRAPEQYLATQQAMLRELLTRYGHVDRVWFDFWGDNCGAFGSGCPKGALGSRGYDSLTALVRELSPETVMLPGVDGCLSDVAVENGEGGYPTWYYRSPGGDPANAGVVCKPTVLPRNDAPAGHAPVWAAREVDQTIMNPGDHWFFDASHPYLKASHLFQYYLDTVGRGNNWILNVPPDRTGSIPANFAAEVSALGGALEASFGRGRALANASQPTAAVCAASAVVLAIPAGVVVDALELREELSASGQSIARYSLELQRRQGGDRDDWVPLTAGVHGETVGSQLIDLIEPIQGPALLRWRCSAAQPAGASVQLSSMAAFKLHPPVGWARPVTTTWALQTLYSSATQDMTPCATRSGSSVSMQATRDLIGNGAANRSSCKAYLTKPGANYTYVRDEHCCLSPPTGVADSVPKGIIPLYLQTSLDDHDHMLSPNRTFSFGGRRYETHGPECYGFPAPAREGEATATQQQRDAATAPLDVYWSASRKDLWSLASDASRAQAISLGYKLVQKEVARVPTAC